MSRPQVEPTPLIFPQGGVSEDKAFASQPGYTTRHAKNVRYRDPVSGRGRGAQRAGLGRLVNAQVSGSNAVRELQKVTYDQKLVDYALLDVTAIEAAGPLWSTQTPTMEDSFAVKIDRQSNIFVLDGGTGIVKYNSAGVEVAKFSLPSTDEYLISRAIALDDFGGVYVASSDLKLGDAYKAGRQSKARIWKLRHKGPDEEGLELDWQIETDAYVEDMVVHESKLYTIQNEPDINKAWIRIYRFIDTEVPEFEWESEAAAPTNGLDVGKSGAIYVASEANAVRGLDPRSPDTTKSTIDWTPDDLYYFERRGWAWLKPDAEFVLTTDGVEIHQAVDNEEVVQWLDSLGKHRDLFVHTGTSPGGSGTWAGPRWIEAGTAAARPSLSFDQSLLVVPDQMAMESAAGFSTDPAQRTAQRMLLPGYTDSQYALFIVCRTDSSSSTSRVLIGNQRPGDTGGHQVTFNRQSTSTLLAALAGVVSRFENGATNGGGAAGHPAHTPYDHIFPYSTTDDDETNGFALITVIHTGGVAGAQESMFRVNGQPIDAWTSAVDPTVSKTQLGWYSSGAGTGVTGSPFDGEIMEILVISDFEDDDGATKLFVDPPDYPTGSWDVAFNDNELDRIEGYFAHKYGISHLMPTGTSATLSSLSATDVSEGDQVFLGIYQAWMYTFRAAPAAAFDVDIGGSAAASLLNLAHAINLTGTPGTDYHAATTRNTEILASETILNLSGAVQRLRLRSIENDDTVFLTTESAAQLAFTAGNSALDRTSLDFTGADGEHGNYPHSFHLGDGPPRIAGTGTPSVKGLLNDEGPLLAKYDPIGDPRWVIVNPPGTNGGIGGVGYGVKVSEETGAVFSIGPKSTTPTDTPSTAEELRTNAVVRKIQDDGDTFSLDGAADEAWEDAWGTIGARDEPQYHYPRMDVDKFDGLYVPVFGATETEAVYVYTAAASATEKAPALEIDLPDGQQGHAVAADQQVPEYDGPGLPTIDRAEKVVIAATNEVAGPGGETTVHQLRLVSVTPNTNTPRAVRVLAVSNGNIRLLDLVGVQWDTITGLAEPQLEAGAFISSVEAFGKAYFVDGHNLVVYDAKEGASGILAAWTSQGSGQITPRPSLVTLWNGRLVLGHFADDPQNWAMSKRADPENWDFFPAVFTADSAVLGNDSQAGRCPDIINGLIPFDDDLLIVLGDHTVQRMTGDPALNGYFDLVSDVTGGAFGKAWCKLPDGTIVFYGSRGGVYAMAPGGMPVRVTLYTIEERLRALDLALNYVRLEYNYEDEGVEVYIIPRAAPATVQEFYFLDVKHAYTVQGSPVFPAWPDTIENATMQVTSSLVLDGDEPGDRVLLTGHGDGYVRFYDKDARDDDADASGNAQRIVSEVQIGPLAPNPGREFMFSGLTVVLADDQQGAIGEFFVRDTPDTQGARVRHFALIPGRNPTMRERMRGTYAYVQIKNAAIGERWALEEMALVALPRGRQRVRT